MSNGRGPDKHERKRREETSEQTNIRLLEKFRGKQALLAEWDLYPDIDRTYRNDLKRRVHHLQQRVTYRGGGFETEE